MLAAGSSAEAAGQQGPMTHNRGGPAGTSWPPNFVVRPTLTFCTLCALQTLPPSRCIGTICQPYALVPPAHIWATARMHGALSAPPPCPVDSPAMYGCNSFGANLSRSHIVFRAFPRRGHIII